MIVALAAIFVIVYNVYGTPVIPRIKFISQGYNVMEGFALNIPSEPDPMWGARYFIFNLNYSNGNLTPDKKYQIPNDIEIEQNMNCTSSQSQNWIYNFMNKPADITKWLDAFITINHTNNIYDNNTWPKRFSSSEPFYDMWLAMHDTAAQFVFDNIYFDCNIYTTINNLHSLTQEFINDTLLLPNIYDESNSDLKEVCKSKSVWNKYVKNYGTHYFQKMHFGCYYDQNYAFWRTCYEDVKHAINITDGALYSALMNTGCGLPADEETIASEYELSYTLCTEGIYYGLKYPTYTVPYPFIPCDNWDKPDGAIELYNNCTLEPWINGFQINSIATLLTTEYFPDNNDINMKQQALIKAYNDWCHCYDISNAYDGCTEWRIK
eukprot:525549_1